MLALVKTGVFSEKEAHDILLMPEIKGVVPRLLPPVQTKKHAPSLPPDITIDTLLAAFPGWSEKLLETHCTLERFGMKRVHAKGGVVQLAIHHNHKEITKICGRDYKNRLRTDPAYIETRQVHIDREQVSALVFDWYKIKNR